MRAEDLFEAMEGIDEKLIARSEKKTAGASPNPDRRDNKKAKEKRRRRAEIYRLAGIAMTTAAAVFLLLVARDFLGARTAGSMQSNQMTAGDEAQQDGAAAEEAAREDAEEEMIAQADEADAGAAGPSVSEEESAPGEAEKAETERNASKSSAETEKSADTKDYAAEQKTAVDLLGDHKGDYVSLEYISAEDEAAGASRTSKVCAAALRCIFASVLFYIFTSLKTL